MNAKIQGQSTHLKAKKGGSQLQSENLINLVRCVCFHSIL